MGLRFRKQKKRLQSWYLIIVMLLIASLVGCSSSSSTSSSAQQPSATSSTASSNINVLPESTTVTPGQKLKVSYIDVGQADSILIQIPNGKNVLIDAGNNEDANTIVSYLKSQGISRLDAIIGTHPHEDHIGSLDTVIKAFDIGQVIMPKNDATTQTYKDVIMAIAAKGLKITEAKAGLKLDLGSDVAAQLFAPNSSNYDDVNDYSAVVKLIYGNNSFLFEGDAQELSENEMIKNGYNLKADVLKVGHHGSHTSSSSAFLAKVQPKYAIISVGKDNSYGHPAQTTIDKLTGIGAMVYRTDQSGTIVAESDGTNITINTVANEVQPRAPTNQSISSTTQTPQSSSTPSAGLTHYIVNTNTKKFHLPTCSKLPTVNKTEMDSNRENMINSGYSPCSICKP